MEKHVVERLTLENLPRIDSLQSLVQGYILNYQCEGKSPKAIKFYSHNLKNFLWFIEREGYPVNPKRIDANHIRAFLTYVANESTRWGSCNPRASSPAKQITIRHYYRVLFTFFKWLHQEGLVSDNPIAHIKTPKIEHKVIQALSADEIEALFSKCKANTLLDSRNRAIFMMFLDSGIRVSELASLKLSNADSGTGTVRIEHGKGGKPRIVRIGLTAQKALWRYVTIYRRGNSDALFLTRSGKPLAGNGIKIMIRRLGMEAGVHNVHVHKLHHTFAISYLRAGGDVFSLQYLLGHSTLQIDTAIPTESQC